MDRTNPTRRNAPQLFAKRTALFLTALLLLGLLGRSALFFAMNRLLPPADIAGTMALVDQRLFLRTLAEGLGSVCVFLYVAGHIGLLWFCRKNTCAFSPKKVLLYFAAHLPLALLCVVPFAVLDAPFSGDYLFPLPSLAVWWLALTVAAWFLCGRAAARQGDGM